MSELVDLLNEIKTEKDTKLVPSVLKKGVNVFGITGELEDLSSSSMQVHFLYRGSNKGDCTLIKTENKIILIDLGNDLEALITKLNNLSITKVDYVIISHFHGDHVASYDGWSGSLEDGYTGDFAYGFRNLLESGIDFSECTFVLPPTTDDTVTPAVSIWKKFKYGETESTASAVEREMSGGYKYHPRSKVYGTIRNGNC